MWISSKLFFKKANSWKASGRGNLSWNKCDIKKVAKRYGIIGISAGSLFIYQGRYDAVLINFLSREDIEDIENITKNVYQIKWKY